MNFGHWKDHAKKTAQKSLIFCALLGMMNEASSDIGRGEQYTACINAVTAVKLFNSFR